MKRNFEDAFMELQSEFISLCLEVAGQKVDEVYAYCSRDEESAMFNAFFKIDGIIKTLDEIGIDINLGMHFLKLGTHDIDKIEDLCTEYNMPIPTEIKMHYDVNTGKYNADYKYDEISSDNIDIDPGEVFMDWVAEIREGR